MNAERKRGERAVAERAMAEILDPYRLELERKGLDLGAVAVVLASAAAAALRWYAFMDLRKAKPLLKDRDAAIKRFGSAAHDLRRLCKDGRVMILGPEVVEALDRLARLLKVQPKLGDQTTVVKRAWPGLMEFTSVSQPPENMPVHRASKLWRRAGGPVDRALFDLGVPQDIRRELLSAIDRQARQ